MQLAIGRGDERYVSTFCTDVQNYGQIPMTMPRKLTLRILLIKEGGQWVAQCLEHDLAAQGPEIDDALDAFASILAAKIIADAKAGLEPLLTCKPAPAHYFTLAQRAKHIDDPVPRRLPDEVPPSWMRVLEPELFVV